MHNIDLIQTKVRETAIYPKLIPVPGLHYAIIGLAGESGELCNKLKKVLRDDGGQVDDANRVKLIDELSDVLWYTCAVASELRIPMSQLADIMLEKVSRRNGSGTIQGSGDNR